MEVRRDRLAFFRTKDQLRRWFEKKHDKEDELWIGFYRKDSGKGGITYAEALDEALCHGWIDGIRKKLDESSYTMRFTPRKARSIWSNVNLAHVKRLIAEGRMAPPGLAAYERRDPARSGVYSFERETASLTPALQKKFNANRKAKAFFDAQSPYYRRMATWWVVSAKRDETRERRLAILIQHSEAGEWPPQFVPLVKRPAKTPSGK
jgi:uncharacterized protein YdeI (YjbR/CyaY-like superfamily)